MTEAQSPQNPGGSDKRSLLPKLIKYGGGGAALLFVGIQFVPVPDTSNPKERAPFNEPKDVEAILRRACYDCHSNEARFPWYSRVAPASWLLADHVLEGREAFNFSEWPEDEDDAQFNREQVWEAIEEGDMPPANYVYPMHLDAILNDKDLETVKAWGAEKEDEDEDEEDEDEDDKKGSDPGKDTKEPE